MYSGVTESTGTCKLPCGGGVVVVGLLGTHGL